MRYITVDGLNKQFIVRKKREKGVLLIAWTSRDFAKDAKENDGVIFEACTPPLKYDQL